MKHISSSAEEYNARIDVFFLHAYLCICKTYFLIHLLLCHNDRTTYFSVCFPRKNYSCVLKGYFLHILFLCCFVCKNSTAFSGIDTAWYRGFGVAGKHATDHSLETAHLFVWTPISLNSGRIFVVFQQTLRYANRYSRYVSCTFNFINTFEIWQHWCSATCYEVIHN